MLLSLICSVDKSGDICGEGVDGGDSCDGRAEQVSQVQSLFLRYCAAFNSPENCACTHPEHILHL